MPGIFEWLQPEPIALYSALIMLALDLFEARKVQRAFYFMLSLAVLLSALFIPYAHPFGFENLRIDVFTVSSRLLLSSIYFLSSLYFSSVLFSKKRPALFASLTFFSLFGAMLVPEAKDIIVLIIAFEISSLSAYALAGFFGSKLEAEASAKYYLMGTFASALSVIGLALISLFSKNTSYEAVGEALAKANGIHELLLTISLILVLSIFTYKTAIFPWQLYVADVYQGQTFTSLLFTSVIPKAAAFLGLSSLFSYLNPGKTISQLIIALTVLTMFYSNLSALVERSVPRIVAFSSVSHAAFMISALLVSSSEKIMLLYTASYTLATLLLIELLASYAKGPDLELKDLYDVARINPLSSFALALAIFSLAGIPPLPLFFAKFYLLKELISSGFIGLSILGAVFSAVAVGYYLRMAKHAFLIDGREVKKPYSDSFPAFSVSLNTVLLLLFVFYLSYFFKILPPQ